MTECQIRYQPIQIIRGAKRDNPKPISRVLSSIGLAASLSSIFISFKLCQLSHPGADSSGMASAVLFVFFLCPVMIINALCFFKLLRHKTALQSISFILTGIMLFAPLAWTLIRFSNVQPLFP
jgi:hypothetical protein